MGILIVISTGLAPEDLVVQDVHCCCCPKMSLKSPVSLLEEDVQLLVLLGGLKVFLRTRKVQVQPLRQALQLVASTTVQTCGDGLYDKD